MKTKEEIVEKLHSASKKCGKLGSIVTNICRAFDTGRSGSIDKIIVGGLNLQAE